MPFISKCLTTDVRSKKSPFSHFSEFEIFLDRNFRIKFAMSFKKKLHRVWKSRPLLFLR